MTPELFNSYLITGNFGLLIWALHQAVEYGKAIAVLKSQQERTDKRLHVLEEKVHEL